VGNMCAGIHMAVFLEIEVQHDGYQTRASLSVPLRYALLKYRFQSPPIQKAPAAGFDPDVSPLRSLSEQESLVHPLWNSVPQWWLF